MLKQAVELFEHGAAGELGRIAHEYRQKLHGRRATFINNFHLNLTNVCVSRCRFCSFRKDADEEGAYTTGVDQALGLVAQAVRQGIREVHLVNALNPELGLDYYTTIIRQIKQNFPELTVKGLTAVEIDFLARQEGVSVDQVIDLLIEAGVELFPGGGAEVFDPGIRRKLGTSKLSAEGWLDIHSKIHARGVRSNATLLYGHYETPGHILDHLMKIRDLQDKTGGFSAFIPLRFIPDRTPLRVKPRGAQYDLKVTALSRIVLDNVPHIKAYWVSLTPEVAQVALSFGADDLDGTIIKENIMHAAGAGVKAGLTAGEMVRLIKHAGFIPVERDSFFRQIRIWEN